MDVRTLRAATWRELALPGADENGYVIWISRDAPGIARLAKDGRLFWSFRRVAYTHAEDVVAEYNRVVPPVLPEAAVRAAIAAQLGVSPEAVPDDSGLLAGMRRALAAYLATTSG